MSWCNKAVLIIHVKELSLHTRRKDNFYILKPPVISNNQVVLRFIQNLVAKCQVSLYINMQLQKVCQVVFFIHTTYLFSESDDLNSVPF